MQVVKDTLPKKFHSAVERWQAEFFPDYEILLKYWKKFFPTQEEFCLCAKHDLDTPSTITIGKDAGKPKVHECRNLHGEQGKRLLEIIKAQASTEFGSIQQHQGTLDKATDDEERFFVMRVMAEELRHGYQMFDLLARDDWGALVGQTCDDFVEEVLSMKTGSHVLGAFNIEYDSFLDSIVFAAIIDRVGKYQLTMQKVCAYRPMGSSMTPMLEEEAFHLVAGVFPLRKWLRKAAEGEPGVSTAMVQRYLNKWIPRGYEMFGHEKGGQTNIEMGFKDMTNEQALANYKAEIERMVEDLNRVYVRARCPDLKGPDVAERVRWLLAHHEEKDGVRWDELLYIPEIQYFRRRGMYAMQRHGARGEDLSGQSLAAYFAHLEATLPEPYLIHRDFAFYRDQMRQIEAGELTVEAAAMQAPKLFRTSYCPCSKSVRWVVEEPALADANGTGVTCEVPEGRS